ncbi:MAG TPA: hypothetical protein VIF09_21845 [Polyangiaceae bacterium]|jgi:hypothetical protein
MRSALRAVVLAAGSVSLAACAAISGLDGITEDDCVPDLCPDASALETGKPEAAGPDGSPGHDAPGTEDSRVEAPAFADASGSDGDAVVVSEASPETSSVDAVDAFEELPLDAPADVHDGGSPVDSAPDSPCGVLYFADSFSSNTAGWALDSTWSVASTCASPPAPQKGNPDPTVDHTTGAAGGVAGAYVCGNNPTGATSPFRYATSPAVDVSAAPSVKLAFYRWLNSDAQGWMTSTVDVYDGSAWVNVYTNPSGSGNVVADSAWAKQEYDVTAQKNAAFRVRFGYAVTDAGVYAMSCWNVDDVTISSLSCP